MKITDLPIIDRSKEEAFEAWWESSSASYYCMEHTAKTVWDAAWTVATLDRAKAEVHAEIRAKLLALAVEVFKEGDTQKAQIIRDLADIRHNIWPEPL